MNRKKKAGLFFGWVVLFPVYVLAQSMASQYQDNLERDVCQATAMAADFLAACQRSGKGEGVGWSWVVGVGSNTKNVGGLASLALLEAYLCTGTDGYLLAAKKYADGLVTHKRPWPLNRLAYKPDIEILARLSMVLRQDAYAAAATRMLQAVLIRSPHGAMEVARIARGREAHPSLLGFDVALAVRAALATGNRRYAYQMADEVIRRMSAWYRPKEALRFSIVSSGALVEALEKLDADHYRDVVADMRKVLLKAQQDTGAWSFNETQPTAYATLGLMGSALVKEREAAQRGLDWLKTTMLRRGCFASYNDYMPEPFVGEVISEVNAEVLRVLSKACEATRR